jgi:hypothetical protein
MGSRQPQKSGNIVKGIGRRAGLPADLTTLQPGTFLKDTTSGLYYLVGDLGVLQPTAGSINNITSAASDGVLLRRTGGAALVVDVGGGAKQARIRATLYKATTNAVVQAAVQVATGADASAVTATIGTSLAPPFAGNENTNFWYLSNSSGVIDLLVTYNATGTKNIVVQYGPDQLYIALAVT